MRNILIGSILILAAALSRLLPHPDKFHSDSCDSARRRRVS